MIPLRLAGNATLAALLCCLPTGLVRADGPVPDGFLQLKPALILSTHYERLRTGMKLALQAVNKPELLADFQEHLGFLLMTPSLVGMDARQDVHMFFLAGPSIAGLPVPVALIPLKEPFDDYLSAMSGLYDLVESEGGVRLLAGARDAGAPDPLFLAIAEGHALVSPNLDALRWLATRRRDRTTPVATPMKDTLLRVTFDGPLLADLLRPLVRRDPVGESAPTQLAHLAQKCSGLDLGFDADVRRFMLTLRLRPAEPLVLPPAPDTAAVQSLAALCGDRNLLGAHQMSGGHLLRAISTNSLNWLEQLANEFPVGGFGVLPGGRGWSAALAKVLTGDVAGGLIRSRHGGFYRVNLFELNDAAAAARTIEALFENHTTATNHFVQPLSSPVSLIDGPTPLWRYRLLPQVHGTNRPSASGFGKTFAQLMDFNHVTLTIHQNRLAVAQGVSGSLEEFLERTGAPGATGDEMARALMPPIPADSHAIGAGFYAPMEILREIVTRQPGFSRQRIEAIPAAGDGLAWRWLQSNDALTWQLSLPASELFSWLTLREKDPGILKDLLTNFVFMQLQHPTDETLRRDLLRDRLQRMREPARP